LTTLNILVYIKGCHLRWRFR